MREIRLLGCRILLWRGAAAEVGENVRAITGGTRAFLLTDRNCRKIAATVRLSLQQAGYTATVHVLSPGEEQKSLREAAKLYDAMLRHKLDRASIFVTVGGGVVGDLGGFVASTYMRGLPLVHVPTTLLAQVDASIGGKTAVNLPKGKNLVGTFHQPRAVFLDPDTMNSLPQREFVGGLAEVVKCAVIRDADLFRFLEENAQAILRREPAPIEEIVFRCASIKAAIVEQDERESGLRAILNYGHTVGHAIEAAGRYRTFHHGEAVSIGMEIAAKIAVEMRLLDAATAEAQRNLLTTLALPVRPTVSAGRILAFLAVDKKGRDGRPRFVLPEALGKVRIGVDVPEGILRSALK